MADFNEILYEDNRLTKEDLAMLKAKLQQLLQVIAEVKTLPATLSFGPSAGWTIRHTEAFHKYLNGAEYYAELLKDDIHSYDEPI